MNTVNLNSTDNVSLASVSGGATPGFNLSSDMYSGGSHGYNAANGNGVRGGGDAGQGAGDMAQARAGSGGEGRNGTTAGQGHIDTNARTHAYADAPSMPKANLHISSCLPSDPDPTANPASPPVGKPGQEQQQQQELLSAGQKGVMTAHTQDDRASLPKSQIRPHSLTPSPGLKLDTPSMPLPSASSSQAQSPSFSTASSASVSRHNSATSTADSSIAHPALRSNTPSTAINGPAIETGGAGNNGGSPSAYHRYSLGYPIHSPSSSTASSPNINSSPYIAELGGPAVNRTASGTVNKKGQSNGFRTPPSPRGKRKPVPPLHLPIVPRELPPSHPFAQSSPRELTHKMSGGQMGNAAAVRNGSGSSSGGNRRDQASPLLVSGSARSWKGGATSSAGGSEPGTPGVMEDKDLFYKPPQASPDAVPAPVIPLGPVPPRRSPSSAMLRHHRQSSSSSHSSVQPAVVVPAEEGIRAEAAKEGEDVERLQDIASAGRRGTFHNGLNIHIPATQADAKADEGRRGSGGIVNNGIIEVAHAAAVDAARRKSVGPSGPSPPSATQLQDSSADTPSPTNTSSPYPAGSEYLNRSLPALPANASKTSLGMFSILEAGPNSGMNGSPPVDGSSRYDRNHSVDSAMTGLTSIETPKDLGRSTTTLDMFSALASGPERKDSSATTAGSGAHGANGATAPLQAYTPSLQSVQTNGNSRKKSGRLGFLSHTSSSSSRRNRSISSTQPGVIPEDEEPIDSNDAFNRQGHRRNEAYSESDDEGFSVSRPPSKRKMFEAGQTYVRDEKGDMIRFADLFPVVNGDAEAEVRSVTKAELKAEMERALRKGHASVASLPSILHEGRGPGSRTSTAGSSTPTHMQGLSVQDHLQPNAPELRSFPSNLATPPSSARPTTSSDGRNSSTLPRNVSGTSGTSAVSPSPFAFNVSIGSSSPIATLHTPSLRTQDVDLRTDRPQPKTVVFFIRTFYCGQCQDYTLASIAHIDPDALKRHNIRLVIISNGNWRHIKPYRELFKCPYPIYVDASRKLYRHMGMTKSTINPGPFFSGRAAYNQKSVPRQWMQSMTTAVKLPKRNPGNLFQLGGEFILDPGYDCVFAHRMTNFSNHMEAADVFRIAGVDAPLLDDAQAVQLDEAQQAEAARLQQEMEDWRAKREATLENMARKKAQRSGQPYIPPSQASRIMLGLDDPSELDMRALQDSDDEEDMERIHGGEAEDEVNGVHPDDIAAVAAGHAAGDRGVQQGQGVKLAPPMVPIATTSSLSTDQPEHGSTGYHTPADTVEHLGTTHVASSDTDKLDVAVGAVSEHGSAPNSAQPSLHQIKPDEEQDRINGTTDEAKEGDSSIQPANAVSSTVAIDHPEQPATQPVQSTDGESSRAEEIDEDEGLSLAEKYERLMRKYEALKVEHDKRSSVAV